jgi:hypothetical protein
VGGPPGFGPPTPLPQDDSDLGPRVIPLTQVSVRRMNAKLVPLCVIISY